MSVKKRKSALFLYNALMRMASHYIIENKDNEAKQYIKECKRSFGANTLLGNELRLAKALIESSVNSRNEADRFINNARTAFLSIDWKQCDAEALSLEIRCDLNKVLKEIHYNVSMFDTKSESVNELLQAWKDGKNIKKVTKLEEAIINTLQEKTEQTVDENVVNDPLVTRLMITRFNERYAKNLNKDQQKLLSKIIFENKDPKYLVESVINDARVSLEKFKANKNKNTLLTEKIDEVNKSLDKLSSLPNDSLVEGCMRVLSLMNEIVNV